MPNHVILRPHRALGRWGDSHRCCNSMNSYLAFPMKGTDEGSKTTFFCCDFWLLFTFAENCDGSCVMLSPNGAAAYQPRAQGPKVPGALGLSRRIRKYGLKFGRRGEHHFTAQISSAPVFLLKVHHYNRQKWRVLRITVTCDKENGRSHGSTRREQSGFNHCGSGFLKTKIRKTDVHHRERQYKNDADTGQAMHESPLHLLFR